MKKHNPVPKAWKKKKSSLKKQLMKSQQMKLKQKHTIEQTAQIRKIIPLKNRKTLYFKNRSSRPWKVQLALSFFVLLMFILAIPAMIVAFFGGNLETDIAAVERERDTTVEIGASPFSVAVMRSTVDTVEDIPLETYVAGVVASEMPAEFELEALKAQALAARTFTVNHLLHGEDASSYDLTDTVQHQVYKNEQELQKQWGTEYTEKMNKIKEAVNATKGQILTHNDAPITAAFFSTSNGYTENSEDYWENELSYLRSVESPWDTESPKYLGQHTFTISQIEEALEVELPNDSPLFIELERTGSDRVSEIGIEGYTFTGRDIREKLDLQSSDFEIKQNNGHLIFTTEGYGHGIGMSQYGANGMAKEGKTYEEIVKYYYQDIDITTINEAVPALVSR
ncbi:stage II sporulation protein D [Oceanobacillus damuensis]|uniref:stage II sporulation protein D n=1 Tax=Oceanobacillus damuensis TaxID=937928 RepID=UPI000B2991AC|nr:stage II sporulation protein D [Oceanobacillus damuensis]